MPWSVNRLQYAIIVEAKQAMQQQESGPHWNKGDAAQHSTAQHSTAQHSTAQDSTALHRTAQHIAQRST